MFELSLEKASKAKEQLQKNFGVEIVDAHKTGGYTKSWSEKYNQEFNIIQP